MCMIGGCCAGAAIGASTAFCMTAPVCLLGGAGAGALMQGATYNGHRVKEIGPEYLISSCIGVTVALGAVIGGLIGGMCGCMCDVGRAAVRAAREQQ
jgi:hypothetical protein